MYTTSHLHEIGKVVLLKKFLACPRFRDQARMFNNKSGSKRYFVAAGEKARVCLYNGKSEEDLDFLSY